MPTAAELSKQLAESIAARSAFDARTNALNSRMLSYARNAANDASQALVSSSDNYTIKQQQDLLNLWNGVSSKIKAGDFSGILSLNPYGDWGSRPSVQLATAAGMKLPFDFNDRSSYSSRETMTRDATNKWWNEFSGRADVKKNMTSGIDALQRQYDSVKASEAAAAEAKAAQEAINATERSRVGRNQMMREVEPRAAMAFGMQGRENPGVFINQNMTMGGIRIPLGT